MNGVRVIEVKDVTKTYGKKKAAFTALKDINFQIPNGASVAIIGKSGSGDEVSQVLEAYKIGDAPKF